MLSMFPTLRSGHRFAEEETESLTNSKQEAQRSFLKIKMATGYLPIQHLLITENFYHFAKLEYGQITIQSAITFILATLRAMTQTSALDSTTFLPSPCNAWTPSAYFLTWQFQPLQALQQGRQQGRGWKTCSTLHPSHFLNA